MQGDQRDDQREDAGHDRGLLEHGRLGGVAGVDRDVHGHPLGRRTPQVREHPDHLGAQVVVDPAARPPTVHREADELRADRAGVGHHADDRAGPRCGDRVGGRGGDEDVAAAHLDRGAGDGDHERAGARVLARLPGRGGDQDPVLQSPVPELLHGRARDLGGEVERVVGHERGRHRVEGPGLGPADRRRGLGDREKGDDDREDDPDQSTDRGDDPPPDAWSGLLRHGTDLGGSRWHGAHAITRGRRSPKRRTRRRGSLQRDATVVARAGIEPATFRFSGGRSYQLSYLALRQPAHPVNTECAGCLATLTGLEPATSAVTGRRANQLRHRAVLFARDRTVIDAPVPTQIGGPAPASGRGPNAGCPGHRVTVTGTSPAYPLRDSNPRCRRERPVS